MASRRRSAASRDNGKKSRGPKTAVGKSISRRNAFRHGLAIAIGSEPAFRAEVEALAKLLVGKNRSVTEFARTAAEAALDLQRIRKTRASQFTPAFENDPPVEAYAELAESLGSLERYERRAFSRRKRALRALTSHSLAD